MYNKIRKISSTASPVPARGYSGPATAGIEYDTAISALVIFPDADGGRAIPMTDFVSFNVPAGATAADYDGSAWIAPYPIEIVSVKERHQTAGSDGGAVTLMLKKVPSGTAKASGTDTLSAGISLKGTADTNASGSLHATAANYRLAAGDALALVTTGTLTAVDGVSVTVEYKRRLV